MCIRDRLDIDGTTNAGDEPALIEMRFHVKTLLTFASRSCAALKSRLSVPVMEMCIRDSRNPRRIFLFVPIGGVPLIAGIVRRGRVKRAGGPSRLSRSG